MKGGESIMRKRVYIKPIGIMVSEEMYLTILDRSDLLEVSISHYIRSAIELKLSQEIENDENNITNK